MGEGVKEQFPPSVKTGIDSIARHIARPIRGCATDDQYTDVVTRATDALNAAAETLVRAGWQPIETAPKDGTRILLWCVHQNAQYAKDARAEGWEAAVIGEWTTHNRGGWVWHGLAGKHTHWMPLPDPPTTD